MRTRGSWTEPTCLTWAQITHTVENLLLGFLSRSACGLNWKQLWVCPFALTRRAGLLPTAPPSWTVEMPPLAARHLFFWMLGTFACFFPTSVESNLDSLNCPVRMLISVNFRFQIRQKIHLFTDAKMMKRSRNDSLSGSLSQKK